eukprot:3952059-Pleurochrysis_carterae.AAC.3
MSESGVRHSHSNAVITPADGIGQLDRRDSHHLKLASAQSSVAPTSCLRAVLAPMRHHGTLILSDGLTEPKCCGRTRTHARTHSLADRRSAAAAPASRARAPRLVGLAANHFVKTSLVDSLVCQIVYGERYRVETCGQPR